MLVWAGTTRYSPPQRGQFVSRGEKSTSMDRKSKKYKVEKDGFEPSFFCVEVTVKSKRHISGIFIYQSLVLVLCSVLPAAAAMAGGLESTGNTDGVLTWNLGTLKPGRSMKKTVIFAYADSRNKLVALLEQARNDLKDFSDSPRITSETNSPGVVWIRNAATDFALGASGSFFWEGKRQALTCAHGGQLSRFGYYVRYNDGESKLAGTSINKEGVLENLRIIQPSRLLGNTPAIAELENIDKRLRLGIHAMMGN